MEGAPRAGRRAPEDERQGAAHDERRGEVRRAAVDLKVWALRAGKSYHFAKCPTQRGQNTNSK